MRHPGIAAAFTFAALCLPASPQSPVPATPRRLAHRHYRLLGVAGDGRLALPHAERAQRRLLQHPAERGRQASGGHLGSGQGHRGGQAVHELRRAEHHARAGAIAHHLGGRYARSKWRSTRENRLDCSCLDRRPRPREPSLQGTSVALWQTPQSIRAYTSKISAQDPNTPGFRDASMASPPPPPDTRRLGGTLKVVTTHIKPGYLRNNGVPFSANAVLTEYYDLHKRGNDEYLVQTQIVEDPKVSGRPLGGEQPLPARAGRVEVGSRALRAAPAVQVSPAWPRALRRETFETKVY